MTAIPTSARCARTVKQFCADYGVGRTFTYAEIKAGRLRAVKAGDRTLILNEDSEAWARSLRVLTPTVVSGEAA
jgi:excisionase family DNA binding protein